MRQPLRQCHTLITRTLTVMDAKTTCSNDATGSIVLALVRELSVACASPSGLAPTHVDRLVTHAAGINTGSHLQQDTSAVSFPK